MRTDAAPGLRRGLPLEPLLPWLHRAAIAAIETDMEEDKGIRALGKRYALRFGGNPGSAARQLQRMLGGDFLTITEEVADRWCALIGLHVDVVWPEEVAA